MTIYFLYRSHAGLASGVIERRASAPHVFCQAGRKR